MATETITTKAPPRICNHCGKSPPTLLRCSQCKLVHYCSRSCQSLAWKAGHRQACRKAKKAADAAATTKINDTMVELMEHVQQMDCRTAYENMCRAQDEIERLQRQLDEMGGEKCVDDYDDVSNLQIEGKNESTTGGAASADTDNESSQSPSTINPEQSIRSEDETNIKRARGSWLDEGGKCSLEYLPNIKCYHMTLTRSDDPVIPNRDDLQFIMSPFESKQQSSSQFVFYDMRLVHSPSSTPLLSLILPAPFTTHQNGPTATITTDSQSISLRIYLQMVDSSSSIDLMDTLVYLKEGSIFSPSTTPSTQMNHLYCRNCHSSPIITSNNDDSNSPTIQSVLPLPSGYWDDIEDYLICYDGQANVDFNTSTMNAIRHVALEDDAVIVLHREDVNESGGEGVCTSRDGRGYGEHSALRSGGGSDNENSMSSLTLQQLWRDKSAMKGGRGNTVTCSKCCATLGFVSGYDSNTLRFYKHLLHCGNRSSSSSKLLEDNVFSKYTCGSFLAREMVRYADNEAIYTFIVGVSDENDWTRLSKSSECILLHMLSWDSAFVGVDGNMRRGCDNDDEAIRFEKVLKVIYDETIDRGQHQSSDQEGDSNGGTQWTWGGMDLCCPPSLSVYSEEDDNEVTSSTKPQIKATAVRIFLSSQEWSELKNTLTTGSEYFSEAVKDAIVMSKLGMPMNGDHSASLSYLPVH